MNAISYMNIAIISSYDNCFINVILCNTMPHVVPCRLPRVGQRRELQLPRMQCFIAKRRHSIINLDLNPSKILR